MQMEASYAGDTYQIELEEDGRSGPGRCFELRLKAPAEDQVVPVQIVSQSGDQWTLEINGRIENFLISETGDVITVNWRNRVFPVNVYSFREKFRHASATSEAPGIAALRAHISGMVVMVLAQEGSPVEAGQGLVVIEAMKMQNELGAPKSGTVITCNVEAGTAVNADQLLFEIE